jgi:hypothetical protein
MGDAVVVDDQAPVPQDPVLTSLVGHDPAGTVERRRHGAIVAATGSRTAAVLSRGYHRSASVPPSVT